MAQEAPKGFVIFYDYRQHLVLLTDEERGKLLLALLDYGESGKAPELDGAALMAFSFIAAQMDRDAQKYAEICRKRSEAGKKGGRPQKLDATEEEAKKANAFHGKQTEAKEANKKTNTSTNTKTNTSTNTCIPPNPPRGKREEAAESRQVQDGRFAVFWEAYPKKVGKIAARNAWNKLKPDVDLFQRIMQAVSTAKASDQWRREGGRFIPNPSTWINQGRWDDEVEPAPPSHSWEQPARPAAQDRRPVEKFDAMAYLGGIIAAEEGGVAE